MGVTFVAFEFKNCPFQLIFAKKYLSIWWYLGVDFDNFAPLLKMWFLYRKSLHVDMVSRFLTILRWLFSLILKLVSDFLTHCISHKVHAYFIRKIPYALENWPHGSKVIDLLAVNGWWWGNHFVCNKMSYYWIRNTDSIYAAFTIHYAHFCFDFVAFNFVATN